MLGEAANQECWNQIHFGRGKKIVGLLNMAEMEREAANQECWDFGRGDSSAILTAVQQDDLNTMSSL
ncbi:hypothetical protein scyTo_0014481 [Scyliorhinus torazame]|uniref:Uncharacterized protein n=1 Tax=Scyliorhinus torazame TaxID=75743 RepID=A0A401NN93_SCYTO|nr:hypothetical protein [Scyliorhinus torazame]